MPSLFKIPLRNHPGVVVVIVLIAGLLLWGFWPKPIAVESIEVKHAPLTVSIETNGRTRVIDRYVIKSPVNGMTCQMHLHIGDHVTQGQTLLSITPLKTPILNTRSHAQAEANVAAAKFALKAIKEQVKSAAASVKYSQNEIKRYQKLLKKGLISQDNYDKIKTTFITATANQRSANFRANVAKYELQAALTTLKHNTIDTEAEANESVQIKSPINGQILKVVRQCDSPVTIGEALLEIGDPTALEVEVDVLSADAVKIKPGMKVLFKRWGGEQPLEGVVRLIEPIGFTKVSALGVEEQRVWVIANFTSPLEQWQRLGDAYRVEANFILWHEKKVLQIPSSSLFRYQDNWSVFIIENNQAKRQTVSIGQRNGLSAQILSGLKEGQMVINHPSNLIEDTVSVKERLID